MPRDTGPERRAPSRSSRLVGRGRDLQAGAGRRLLEARDEHVTIRLLTDAFREDRDTGGALLAGALAFRLFLWLLPAGLVVVALLGFSSSDDVRRGLSGVGLGGFATTTIAQAASQAHDARWLLLLIGLAGLYSTSVDLAKALWIGTSLAWHLPVSRLRRQPRAAAAVAALLLAAAAATLAVNWLRSVALAAGLAATVLVIALYALLGWFALRALPHPVHTTASDLLPGALLIGAGVQALHLVTVLFLANRISSSSQLYGALGGAATLLLWGYLLARVLVGASTLNRILFRYRDVARLPAGADDAGAARESLSARALPGSVRSLPARLRADWHELEAAVGQRGRAGRGSGRRADTGGAPEAGTPAGTPTSRGTAAGEGTGSVAALTLWRFDDEEGAEAASRTLGDLHRQGALRLIDAAVVTWPAGSRRPRASQVVTPTGKGALGGAFWGLLLGVIFFAPLLGLAVGAAAGALGGTLRDAGISEAFIQQARDAVTPGTSALFVVSSDVDVERVRAAFPSDRPTLIHTNLTPEQDAALREYFGT
ncbi:YhjD/YihY/BrkB family envelope integrity protein [Terrabacter sp. BE26]|uniref:YhjD/YihY/BrkB family envelope integrity protein n=1 Tax=Terrabacter sp. BE26 TaxID=2898152 RepID=UPI0035BE2B1D